MTGNVQGDSHTVRRSCSFATMLGPNCARVGPKLLSHTSRSGGKVFGSWLDGPRCPHRSWLCKWALIEPNKGGGKERVGHVQEMPDSERGNVADDWLSFRPKAWPWIHWQGKRTILFKRTRTNVSLGSHLSPSPFCIDSWNQSVSLSRKNHSNWMTAGC